MLGAQLNSALGDSQRALAILGDMKAGLTATGTNQGTAFAITEANNVFTTVASNTGARLPVCGVADLFWISNLGANALKVYPSSGGSINGGSTNAAVSLPAGGTGAFKATTSKTFTALLPAAGSGTGTVTSVDLSAPDIFTVSGNPVTAAGTLAFTPVDAGADKIVFWDDSAGKWVYLTIGTGLSITGTTLSASGGSGPVLQVAVTEDLTGGSATGTFSDVVLSTTPATITPLSSASHLLIEVSFVGSISQNPGDNFAGGNYNIFDVENTTNVGLAALTLQAQSENSEAILLTSPLIMRAWVANTVTSARRFELVGAVNEIDTDVILVANALLWSITEVED